MSRDLVLFVVSLVLVSMAAFHFTRLGPQSWELVVDITILAMVLRNWKPWRRRQ